MLSFIWPPWLSPAARRSARCGRSASGGREPLPRALRAFERVTGPRHAVDALVLGAPGCGRGLAVARGRFALRLRGRLLVAALEGGLEVLGSGQHGAVERPDVDAVVEQHPVTRPREPVDEIDAAPRPRRHTGQVGEVLHLLAAPELVDRRCLGHTPASCQILPARSNRRTSGILRLTN